MESFERKRHEIEWEEIRDEPSARAKNVSVSSIWKRTLKANVLIGNPTSNAKRTYHEITSVDRKFWLYYTFKHFQFIVVHPKYTCLKFDFFNPLNIYDLYICLKKRTNVLYGYRWFLIYSFASFKGTPYVFLSLQGIRLHLDELAHKIALIKSQVNIETREECINLSHI